MNYADPQSIPSSFKRYAWILVAALVAFMAAAARCQTVSLTVGSAVATPGGTFSVPISMASGGTSPAGFQFTLSPGAELSAPSAVAGPAAVAAGKAIQCSGSTCIIFGLNANVVADGVIAIASFSVASGAVGPLESVALTGLSTADPAGNSIPIFGLPGGAWLQGASAALSRNPCSNVAGPGLTIASYLQIVSPQTVNGIVVPSTECAQFGPNLVLDRTTIPPTVKAVVAVPHVEQVALNPSMPQGQLSVNYSPQFAPAGPIVVTLVSSQLTSASPVAMLPTGASLPLVLVVPTYRPFVAGADYFVVQYWSLGQ